MIWWIVAGVASLLTAAVVFGGGATRTPARDLRAGESLDYLKRLGVVVRDTVSEYGTISVSSHLGGVVYRYAGSGKPVDRGHEEMAPQTAVLLIRLGEWLSQHYGVTTVDHLGIFPGRDPEHNHGETHNRGLAVDLSGFASAKGALNVLKDWGSKPKISGRYRLKPGEPGYQFFQDLYAFLSSETTNGGTLGAGGYLITPDHHETKLSDTHADHIHAQLGPTRI